MIAELIAQLTGNPDRTRKKRGMPARRPYSAQPQFGRSGTAACPCGGVRIPRGMGWSNGHTSTFTTMCTMRRLPPGPLSGARSSVSS